MEDDRNFDEDWRILRRKNAIDTPTTLSIAEGFERLVKALDTFFYLNDEADNRRFYLAIEHKRVEDSPSQQLYRVVVRGLKDGDRFKALNECEYNQKLERALEHTFNTVASILEADYDVFQKEIEQSEQQLLGQKKLLMQFRNNRQHMGSIDLAQQPLDFHPAEKNAEN